MADVIDSNVNNDPYAAFTARMDEMQMSNEQVLRSIDMSLREIVRNQQSMSQSAARDRINASRDRSNSRNFRDPFDRRNRRTDNEFDDEVDFTKGFNDRMRKRAKSAESQFDKMIDGFEDELFGKLFGEKLTDKLGKAVSNFANAWGVNVDDLGQELGKRFGSDVADLIKSHPLGKELSDRVSKFKEQFSDNISDALERAGQTLKDGGSVADSINSGLRGFGTSNNQTAQDQQDRGPDVNAQDVAERAKDVADVVDNIDDVGSHLDDVTGIIRNIANGDFSNIANLLKVFGEGGDLSQLPALITNLGSSTAAAEGAVAAEGAAAAATSTELATVGAATAEAAGGAAAMGAAGTEAAAGAAAAGAGMAGLTVSTGGLALALLAIPLIIKGIEYGVQKFQEAVEECIKPIKESWEGFKDTIKKAANREMSEADKRLENYKDRIKKDNEVYLRAPFEILKDAANKAYEVWDNVAHTITQTQGYDKAGLQDLWSNYARRLQEEGLDSVVSSADIMSNLEQVIKAGMSGQVAEEFAYMATVLNNAIPTEEFFNYASTYASIAANAIKNGKSQSEAIEDANKQLEEFASNLLYSSRQLAGGFSTGLTHAEGLFEAANNIAVAAHTDNAGDISGVLTSVAAIVGAIAPDLTQSIVTKITDAATGGNSSELVALRSLAGTGASNTAFLQAMASDPQAVFIEMFSNLAQMQNMYGDNYMEVAESLSKTFGLSMDEMSRIDFGYLAQAVSAMDLNNASLNENIALLASGDTTLTADQLRMQQINQYMIDEGLSYVLDNEVARAIQEHMWDEQIANMLMENTYSTELTGASMELVQGIQMTLENIFTRFNPFGWMKKVESLQATMEEGIALNADIQKMLEKGNLGKSNPATLYNLTHGNTDLHLTKSYLELLGGRSAYSLVQTAHGASQVLLGNTMAASDTLKKFVSQSILSSRKAAQGIGGAVSSLLGGKSEGNGISSQYTWSTIGKSITQSLFTTGNKALYNSGSAYGELGMSAQDVISSRAAKNMQAFLDTMQDYVNEHKSYEEWAESAADYGIEDLGSALQDYGLNETQAKGKFQEMEAVQAAMWQHERDMKEEQFWDDMIKWAEEDFPAYVEQVYIYYDDIIAREDSLISNTDIMIGQLDEANKQLKEFYHQWVEYFVNHTAYHRDTLNAHDIEAIRYAEQGETGDAVFALAQALTDNMVNLQDPQVQGNALLSQILLVTEAIFQIENNTTTVSLPTALSSLGLGVTSVENQY